jgi:hypothetical protein
MAAHNIALSPGLEYFIDRPWQPMAGSAPAALKGRCLSESDQFF